MQITLPCLIFVNYSRLQNLDAIPLSSWTGLICHRLLGGSVQENSPYTSAFPLIALWIWSIQSYFCNYNVFKFSAEQQTCKLLCHWGCNSSHICNGWCIYVFVITLKILRSDLWHNYLTNFFAVAQISLKKIRKLCNYYDLSKEFMMLFWHFIVCTW